MLGDPGAARDPRRLVVGLGGRALAPADLPPGAGGPAAALAAALVPVLDLLATGAQVALTHGIGPALADQLARAERALPEMSPDPLDLCLAQAQAATGYALEHALARLCREREVDLAVLTVITRVVVDADDPAFRHPAAPIGPDYAAGRARQLARGRGWTLAEAGRGRVRRVVPAPEPRRVLEAWGLVPLLQAGVLVIAAGAGGVPVVETETGFHGVEALVQPDLVTGLLATAVGADRVVFLTDVAQVAVGFGTSRSIGIERLTPVETRALQAGGEFPAGSIGPKVEAAVRFVEAGGREALITSPAYLGAALAGEAGTRIGP
jgi:carbamate kinase